MSSIYIYTLIRKFRFKAQTIKLFALVTGLVLVSSHATAAACTTTSTMDLQVMRAINQNPCGGGAYIEPAFRIDNFSASPVNVNTLTIKFWTNQAVAANWGFEAWRTQVRNSGGGWLCDIASTWSTSTGTFGSMTREIVISFTTSCDIPAGGYVTAGASGTALFSLNYTDTACDDYSHVGLSSPWTLGVLQQSNRWVLYQSNNIVCEYTSATVMDGNRGVPAAGISCDCPAMSPTNSPTATATPNPCHPVYNNDFQAFGAQQICAGAPTNAWVRGGTATNNIMFLVIQSSGTAAFAAGATYAGTPLVYLRTDTVNHNGTNRTQHIYYLVNPATGSNNLILDPNPDNCDNSAWQVFSYSGINAVSPLGTINFSASNDSTSPYSHTNTGYSPVGLDSRTLQMLALYSCTTGLPHTVNQGSSRASRHSDIWTQLDFGMGDWAAGGTGPYNPVQNFTGSGDCASSGLIGGLIELRSICSAGSPTSTLTISPTPSRTPIVSATASPTISASPTATVTPVITATVAPCAIGISVDGVMNEGSWGTGSWNSISEVSISNPSPVNAVFKVMWNSTYLYVGIDVNDGNLYADSGSAWEDDSIAIFIDRNNAGTATYQADDDQISLRHNLAGGIFVSNGHSAGLLANSTIKAGSTGYVIEVAIPWSTFGAMPAAGTTIGFDITVDTDHLGGTRDGQLVWAGDANNYLNTSLFGDVTLGSGCATPSPTATVGPMACMTPDCSGSWNIVGDGAIMGPGYIRLTNDVMWQSTAMWSNFMIDLTQAWTTEYDLYFGTKDGSGADGIVFLMHNDSRGLAARGDNGQGISYANVDGTPPGITPSLAVEFDTWQNNTAVVPDPINYNDPACDHTSIHINGDGNESAPSTFGTIQASSTNCNIEDNAWHRVRLVYNPAGPTYLSVYFDGVLRISYTADLRNTVFGGLNCVYWGFTAGTGGSSNLQEVKEIECNSPTPTRTQTPGGTPSVTFSMTRTFSNTPVVTPTFTATLTRSPTVSNSPTQSRTNTPGPTATPAFPLVKSANLSQMTIGQTVTFCMTWTNDSSAPASNVIWDTVSSFLTYIGCDNTCSKTGAVASWTVTNLGAGLSVTRCFWGTANGYPLLPEWPLDSRMALLDTPRRKELFFPMGPWL